MRTLLFAAVSTFAVAAEWSQIPPIPDTEGFAGSFAGVSGGALIVAGGANITARKWEKDFVKTWHDSIFVLDHPDGNWQRAGRLPRACGYGVSITAPDGLVCIGGSDATQHYADVLAIRSRGPGKLPPLPKPCAMMCGALVGQTIYVAGGIERPDSTTALATLWALDLAAKERGWQQLDPCPGPARILAVAAAGDGAFYYMSGASLSTGPDGKAVRTCLRDAWRYRAGRGWERLADLPRAAVAAPSPAPVKDGRVFIFTGDDGANLNFEPIEKHPGFPRDTLVFDTKTNVWSTTPDLPFSRATVPVVEWNGRFVIPNGEVRPRVRTNEVWSVKLP